MSIIADAAPITDPLLTPAEVASLFRVDPRTINRWAATGSLRAIRTPGGKLRRFRQSDVRAALQFEAVNA